MRKAFLLGKAFFVRLVDDQLIGESVIEKE
jgi:hypothetical protein